MMILNAIRQAAAAAGLLAMTISIAQADGLVDDAQALLDALSAEQQNAVIHPFEDDDRFDWHFIPKASRKGLPIRDMNAAQVTLTHDLLKTVLSAAGYKKTDKIVSNIEEVKARAGRIIVTRKSTMCLSLVSPRQVVTGR